MFGFSIIKPPTVIERIARISNPNLPELAIGYCENVTKIWCLFFLINAIIALFLAVHENHYWWVLYNGLISYCLIGLIFIVELFFRQRKKQQIRSTIDSVT